MNKIDTVKTPSGLLSYLAMGDSYTIGEAVSEDESFPYQLIPVLNAAGLKIAAPKIIAKTGWTTGQLAAAIKAAEVAIEYDIVTLLIGVNNQYRGNSIDTYRTEFRELLQTAINFAGGNAAHVFVISIPDWGVTPYGKQSERSQEEIAVDIDAFNRVNKKETLKFAVSYTDITATSRNAATDHTLVASDGLHPSAEMYKSWAVDIAPAMVKAFK